MKSIWTGEYSSSLCRDLMYKNKIMIFTNRAINCDYQQCWKFNKSHMFSVCTVCNLIKNPTCEISCTCETWLLFIETEVISSTLFLIKLLTKTRHNNRHGYTITSTVYENIIRKCKKLKDFMQINQYFKN